MCALTSFLRSPRTLFTAEMHKGPIHINSRNFPIVGVWQWVQFPLVYWFKFKSLHHRVIHCELHLKWGHPCVKNTLIGPKGGQIKWNPLYYRRKPRSLTTALITRYSLNTGELQKTKLFGDQGKSCYHIQQYIHFSRLSKFLTFLWCMYLAKSNLHLCQWYSCNVSVNFVLRHTSNTL